MDTTKLSFRLLDPRLVSPRTGLLTLYRAISPNAGYIPNSTVERFTTGVDIAIPAGVTVELLPLPEHESRGVYLHTQRIDGPAERLNLSVTLHNLSHATVKLEPGAPLARLLAYRTPAAAVWHELPVEVVQGEHA